MAAPAGPKPSANEPKINAPSARMAVRCLDKAANSSHNVAGFSYLARPLPVARLTQRERQVADGLVGSGRALVADVDLQTVDAGRQSAGVPAEGAGGAEVAGDAPAPAGVADPEAVLGSAGAARGAAQQHGGAVDLGRGLVGAQAGRRAGRDGEPEGEVGDRLIGGAGALVAHVDLQPVGALELAGGAPAVGAGGAEVLDHGPDPVLADPESVLRGAQTTGGAAQHHGGAGPLGGSLAGGQASAATAGQRVGEVGHAVVGHAGGGIADVDLDSICPGGVGRGVPAERVGSAVVL